MLEPAPATCQVQMPSTPSGLCSPGLPEGPVPPSSPFSSLPWERREAP